MSQNKKRYNLIKTITSSKIYTVLKSINSDEILKLINYQDNSQFIIDLINNGPHYRPNNNRPNNHRNNRPNNRLQQVKNIFIAKSSALPPRRRSHNCS